jgi:hypothetical protein
MLDFNRIARLVSQTKEKVIVAAEDEMLVVMSFDNYEKLVKGPLEDKPIEKKIVTATAEAVAEPVVVASAPVTVAPTPIREVLAKKSGFSPDFQQKSLDNTQVDEEDEYYFEEIDD